MWNYWISVAFEFIVKRILDKYYNKTGESEVYRIAMGTFPVNSKYVKYSESLTVILVLHPHYKLEFFKRNNWDELLIEVAHEIVQDEFDRSYWLLDIEGDDSTSQADGSITVHYSFADT